MTGDEGTFEVRWLPHSSKVNQGPSSVSAVSPAFAICVNYLWISHLMNFGLRTRELTSLHLTPIYGQGWVRMLSNGGLPYTHRPAPQIHVCTWNVTSLAALQNHHDKLAHVQVGRVKGFVLLQETNWTPAQPATLTTAHPHINIAASNLPPEQTGSGCVCILPPLGWTQIEHTEIIPGFLQDALYEKYGAQVRVINVYVHPARTKEIGARLISHLAHISTRVLSSEKISINFPTLQCGQTLSLISRVCRPNLLPI